MLILFQFESCPYCAKVRDKLTELAVDFASINVPKGKEKRAIVKTLGGQDMTPMLIDTDHNVIMYESGDINDYLEKTYS